MMNLNYQQNKRVKEKLNKYAHYTNMPPGLFADYRRLLEREEELSEALIIAANQLEGVSMAIAKHKQNINVGFFIDECYANAQEARLLLNGYL